MPVLGPYVVCDLLRDGGFDERQEPSQEQHEEIVTMRGDGRRGTLDRPVPLRGPTDGRADVIDEDLEVAAAGQFVEVMPGDVRVQVEVLSNLAGGHCLTVPSEQVDAAAGCVSEGRRDRGDSPRETISLPAHTFPLLHLAHPVIVPVRPSLQVRHGIVEGTRGQ